MTIKEKELLEGLEKCLNIINRSHCNGNKELDKLVQNQTCGVNQKSVEVI